MHHTSRGALFLAALLFASPAAFGQTAADELPPPRGTASLAFTVNRLSQPDSAWSGSDQTGMMLRLGIHVGRRGWRVEFVPHVQLAATSVGGVDSTADYALADGEIGVQVRYRVTDRLRPYAAIRYPLWHTIEVERGTQRRDYALSGGTVHPSFAGGVEYRLFRTGAGLDLGVSRTRGAAGLLEVFDSGFPQGHPDRFTYDENASVPYSAWRVYLGYSGPFSIIDPVPRRLSRW
jgi:hypothetical protein